MQLILTENIAKLGHEYDIVNVKRGYARNFLLPQRKAMLATPAAIARTDKMREERLKKLEEVIAAAKEIAEKIGKVTLTFKKKVRGDKLYGSIGPKDVVAELAKSAKIEIKKDMVKMNPIKTIGDYKAIIHLAEGVDAKIKISVEAEA